MLKDFIVLPILFGDLERIIKQWGDEGKFDPLDEIYKVRPEYILILSTIHLCPGRLPADSSCGGLSRDS